MGRCMKLNGRKQMDFFFSLYQVLKTSAKLSTKGSTPDDKATEKSKEPVGIKVRLGLIGAS